MSLIVLIVCELVFWIFMNRATPFSTPRLTVMRNVAGYVTLFGGLYVAYSLVFMQFTLLDPIDTLWFLLVNAAITGILSVRQYSMSY
jgi:hypothetical protein